MTFERYYPATRFGGSAGGGKSDDTIPTNVVQNLLPNVEEALRTSGGHQDAKYFIQNVSGTANKVREMISKLSLAGDHVRLKYGTDFDTVATVDEYGWQETGITWTLATRTVTISTARSLAKGDVVWFYTPIGVYRGRAKVNADTSSSTTFVIDSMADGSNPQTGDMAMTWWHGSGEITEALDSADSPQTVVAMFDAADGIFRQALLGLVNHDNLYQGKPVVEFQRVVSKGFSIGEGGVFSDDCSNITGWTDEDTGVGESSQVTFQGRDCFKLTIPTAGGGNVAQRTIDVGTIDASFTFEIRLFLDIGSVANSDMFTILVDNGTIMLRIRFGTDGLFVYDGSGWVEVGTNIVETECWNVWRFTVDGSSAGSETVDIYKDDLLVGDGIDCSDASGTTDGSVTIKQNGTTTSGVTTHVDNIEISDGAPDVTGLCYIATEGIIQSNCAAKTRGAVEGTESETFDVDGLTLVVRIDSGSSQTITLSGSGQSASDVVGQINAVLSGGTAYVHDSDRVAIRTDSYYKTGSVQVLSASTADSELGLDNSIHSGTDGTVAACVLELGDIEPGVSTPAVTGSGSYNHSSYPVLVYQRGTVWTDVTVTFTDSSNFTVSMVLNGNSYTLGSGSISADFQIPHLGEFYFTIQAAGWGGTWAAGNTLTFTTYHSAVGVWAREIIPASTPAYQGNKTELSVRAQG